MARKTFVKLDLSSGGKSVFLLTSFKDQGEEGFDLTLTNGVNVWTGYVSDDDMDEMKKKMKMDYRSYVKQTAQAFTKENTGNVAYQYQLVHKKDSAVEFIWKKHVPAEDITFQLGSTILKCSTSQKDKICMVLEYCIKNSEEQQEIINSLQTDNERLSLERINALKRLQKCIEAKEELEKDLYAKFVAVLNAKKDRIKQLKDQMDNGVVAGLGNSGSDEEPKASTSCSTSHSVATKSNKKRVLDSGNEDKTDSEINTSDEETPAKKQSKRTKAAKVTSHSDEDDSLVLDDASSPSYKAAKRPVRQMRGNKKQTPSKPVLPKVPSKDSSSSSSSTSSRKPSNRKSTSNRSADNLDVDDLLAGMI